MRELGDTNLDDTKVEDGADRIGKAYKHTL